MIAISYTLTPTIQDYLLEIDRYHRNILLAPTPIMTEQRLRWLATSNRVYGSLRLRGTVITASQLRTLLLNPVKHPAPWEKEAIAYKNALDVIRADWTANLKPLQASHIGALSLISLPNKTKQIMGSLKESQSDIKQLLAYAGSQKDHPLLLAGVMYGQLMQTEIRSALQGILPPLIVSVILAKYGYDCRGMLALEPQWTASIEAHDKAIKSISIHSNLTAWLEYFIASARASYEAVYTRLQEDSQLGHAPSFAETWNLNQREENILHFLENPTAKITNKVAQRLFRVSQITASRDLSHLASLGLLLVHGKGRSVYYTKA